MYGHILSHVNISFNAAGLVAMPLWKGHHLFEKIKLPSDVFWQQKTKLNIFLIFKCLCVSIQTLGIHVWSF